MTNKSHKDKVVSQFLESHPEIGELIYDIAEMRRQFEREPKNPSSEMAKHWEREGRCQHQQRYSGLLLPAAMGLAGAAVGLDARRAYMAAPAPKDTVDCVRAKALAKLALQIDLLNFLLPDLGADGEISIRAAAIELTAIAHGDDPRHFAKIDLGPKSRRRGNAWRLAFHKARALMWDAYFRAEGLPPKEVKLMVGHAFGEDHTTYIRWADPVRNETQGFLDRMLNNAKNERHRLAKDIEEAKRKLTADGRRYRAELRRGE